MYILDLFKKQKPVIVKSDKEKICIEISMLEQKLQNVRSCFELTVDNDIIEALIYEENSIISRLSQLRKLAKEKNIKADFIDRQYYNKI